MIKNYAPNEQAVQAEHLNFGVLEDAAKWCGGKAVTDAKVSDPLDSSAYLLVPTLNGVEKANLGDYLVRSHNGRFAIMSKTDFEAKYHEVGLRQDGPLLKPRRGIDFEVAPPVDGYGIR